MEKAKNRKERRALQFGSDEARAAVIADMKARAPIKIVKEVDGVIVIPKIEGYRIEDYMIPYRDLDGYGNGVVSYYSGTKDQANTIPAYGKVLSDWFYGGLTMLVFRLKPNVKTPEGKEATQQDLLRYVWTILGDWGCAHEHKFVYLTYVLDTCCTSVTWATKEKE